MNAEAMTLISSSLKSLGVIPVIAIEDASHAPDLMDALVDGDLPCVEITFRTSAALDAIKSIKKSHPSVLLGAGTILSVDQAQAAVDAGVEFLVSPGINSSMVTWCLENEILVIPGIVTPTELMWAIDLGLQTVKFFPAESIGGLPLLKVYHSVFPSLDFIPTGGIKLDNLEVYLSQEFIHSCGGTWIAPKRLISDRKFDEIKQNVLAARNIVKQVRGK